ncbi:MAG: hypothetical protein Q8Q42_03930 [Nanoarchaeota archaeon]|nr:hypothetical protein [Nanoarchaeota archaeon]
MNQETLTGGKATFTVRLPIEEVCLTRKLEHLKRDLEAAIEDLGWDVDFNFYNGATEQGVVRSFRGFGRTTNKSALELKYLPPERYDIDPTIMGRIVADNEILKNEEIEMLSNSMCKINQAYIIKRFGYI